MPFWLMVTRSTGRLARVGRTDIRITSAYGVPGSSDSTMRVSRSSMRGRRRARRGPPCRATRGPTPTIPPQISQETHGYLPLRKKGPSSSDHDSCPAAGHGSPRRATPPDAHGGLPAASRRASLRCSDRASNRGCGGRGRSRRPAARSPREPPEQARQVACDGLVPRVGAARSRPAPSPGATRVATAPPGLLTRIYAGPYTRFGWWRRVMFPRRICRSHL